MSVLFLSAANVRKKLGVFTPVTTLDGRHLVRTSIKTPIQTIQHSPSWHHNHVAVLYQGYRRVSARQRNGRIELSFSTSVIMNNVISLSSTRRTSIVKGRI